MFAAWIYNELFDNDSNDKPRIDPFDDYSFRSYYYDDSEDDF